jgi:hypothetical protein
MADAGDGGNAEALPVALSPPQAANARPAASVGARIHRRDRIEVIEFSFVIEIEGCGPS